MPGYEASQKKFLASSHNFSAIYAVYIYLKARQLMRKGGGSYSTYAVSMMTLGTRLYSVLTVSSLHTKEI